MTIPTPAPSRLALVMPPPGTTECAYGETTYSPEPDGTILVPVEALPGLLTVAGFELIALEDLEPAAPDVAQ